ncbi:lipoprotein-releasing ABC transporter permease subunit LolE [Proteus terrae subsp. cibarius]|uniref:Lipoprotein-releasing ABC transporter permease subunit LolE n=1 Tax=Proteus terrae subsp. cibarius TaxID=626774 RepID=A0ABX6JLR7_9GAMM|nr:lipoprotein-releasing ABC transporter permease subunit LolE [Proteus terrae]QGW02862.1 lipoprotein-releasing ABC transporter permease subunit LolE [Proteus terrae subsp. cibarius]QHD95356.1 lipoprotein-releasing ABC transporter permease subunit LolE [Proteus terrae subsp. cibarius]QIF90124.1 lipoprotein-releasing ABC transporter permease subunit LolE [Proteus terrae subsp. cibarius]QIF97814.1 lipoprotein-releasing ABC transporter permease subunit LolE [Proteus terrae subsp. cibarius]QJW5071
MAQLPLALVTALRFSRGRKRAGMVSLISVISTLGIMLGVAVLIIGLSAMNGFERELKNRILSVVPHGQIYSVEQPFMQWQSALPRIENTQGVVAAAPYVLLTGLLEKGTELKAVQVMGVSPEKQGDISLLPRYVQNNAWQDFKAGKQQIIIGQGVADALKIKQDDWLTVLIPNNDDPTKLLQPKRIRLQVSGIFKLSGMLDHQLALIPLADAQKYMDYGQGITGIEVKTVDPFFANEIIHNAGLNSKEYVYAKSWISDYGYMYSDIQMIRSIMYLSMILVIGVACFNIVSTLIMAVRDKSSDIAILRTLGARDSHIRNIFLWYGLLSGMIGCIAGVIFGVLVAYNLTPLVSVIESLTGHSVLSGDVYFVDFLPSEVHLIDVFSVFITTVILSLIASWYPARRATKLDPARILSGQ